MGIWKRLREKFSSSKSNDDAQFTEEAPVINDERLQWVMDNFSGWPSPSYQYVALIEKSDPVVGTKRTLKFFKRPTDEGVESYPREYIDSLLNSGE